MKKVSISCNLFHYSRVLLNILQNIYDTEEQLSSVICFAILVFYNLEAILLASF